MLTIWTLNAVSGWDDPSDPQKLISALKRNHWWGNERDDVQAGNRSKYNADLDPTCASHALSFEGDSISEYFVPIIVKCIGDPDLLRRQLGPNGQAMLGNLLAAYPEFYPDQWKTYWNTMELFGRASFTRMNTSEHRGYFSILLESTPNRAVLLGYSQGGLVGRFLAWMDENLWRCDGNQPTVAAVVTCNSPNRGTPAADQTQLLNLEREIFSALGALIGLPRHKFPSLHPQEPMLETSRVLPVLALVDKDEPARHLHHIRKYLSGLHPIEVPTAVTDMSPREAERKFRVLNLLNSTEYGLKNTYQAAIVSAGNSASNLLSGILGDKIWLAPLLAALKLDTRQSIKEAFHCYSVGLNGTSISGGSVIPAEGYQGVIPPLAHDFVVPSLAQTIGPIFNEECPDEGNPYFLGNAVLLDSCHLHGKDRAYTPMIGFLRELGKRIPQLEEEAKPRRACGNIFQFLTKVN